MDRGFSRYWCSSCDSLPEKQDQLATLTFILPLAPPDVCFVLFYSDTETHSFTLFTVRELHQEVNHYITTFSLHGWCDHEFSNGDQSFSMQVRVGTDVQQLPFWIVTLAISTTNFHVSFHSFSDISVSLFSPQFL